MRDDEETARCVIEKRADIGDLFTLPKSYLTRQKRFSSFQSNKEKKEKKSLPSGRFIKQCQAKEIFFHGKFQEGQEKTRKNEMENNKCHNLICRFTVR